MKKPEILSPVGGSEQLIAAVRTGADAVYFGAVNFNARRNAKNFTEDEFVSAVHFCHSHGLKAYITLNTLVKDSEIPDLVDEIRLIASAGADAVIVQDLAVASLVRQICPEIPLHASTQMTIHNTFGVKCLEKMGFSRVVPARELSLDEIKMLTESTLETEIFVHGALCMSVSGCCYLSSILGGRSGNRGLCAQPCRLPFTANGRKYALSLKDMTYIPHIYELENIGVDSLKIEGRMKRPEYVAAVTDACKREISGEKADIGMLGAVFSRQGFTDGYLTKKRNMSMFGYRTKEDVTSANSVLSGLTQLYKSEKQTIPVNMSLLIFENGKMELKVTDKDGNTFSAFGTANKAENKPLDLSFAEKFLKKTGGTPFFANNIEISNEFGMMCAPSALNEMRRNALEGLLQLRENSVKYHICDIVLPDNSVHTATERKIYARYEKFSQLTDEYTDAVILPLDEILTHGKPDLPGLIAEIPELVFAEDEQFLIEKLGKLRKMGVADVCVHNIGFIGLCREMGFTVHGGYGLNILNSCSLNEYAKLGLCDTVVSFELAARDIQRLTGDMPRGVITYGYLPLMKFRACPLKLDKNNKTVCNCNDKREIKDRYGTAFPVLCRDKKYSIMLNSVPLSVIDKPIKNTDFSLLYFTIENAEECKKIIQVSKSNKNLDKSHTNGLYFRELL